MTGDPNRTSRPCWKWVWVKPIFTLPLAIYIKLSFCSYAVTTKGEKLKCKHAKYVNEKNMTSLTADHKHLTTFPLRDDDLF